MDKELPPIPPPTPMASHHPGLQPPPTTSSNPPSNLSPPFLASTHAHDQKSHLLLAATGSVATIKIPLLLSHLSRHPTLSIILLVTPSARRFLVPPHSPPLSEYGARYPNLLAVLGDEDEWVTPWQREGGILHIELRRWADLLVVAPLSANSLAGVVGGFANGLLLSVIRAWDARGGLDAEAALDLRGEEEGEAEDEEGRRKRPKKRLIIVAPAMNTAMWRHPVTRKHIRVLEEEWGVSSPSASSSAAEEGREEQDGVGWFEVLRPIEKRLACGDVGDGAMRDWREICGVIEERLGLVRKGVEGGKVEEEDQKGVGKVEEE